MSDLRTDFKDDVLNVTTNEKRKYRMINNADGTISFEDVTDYVQQGDTFGATEVNQIIEKVNSCLTRQDVVDNLESTATDLPLSANMGNKLSESMGVLLWENSNLTADFAQQNITLPSADYDYLKIFWVSLSGCCHCEEVLKGYSTALSFSYAAGNSPNRSHFLIYRTITRNSDTSFSVTDSILSMSSINAEYTKTTNNSLNKPYKIYGCKFK